MLDIVFAMPKGAGQKPAPPSGRARGLHATKTPLAADGAAPLARGSQPPRAAFRQRVD